MREISLPLLLLGEQGVVTRVDSGKLTNRLTELGFIPGNAVRRLYSDRTGSLSAYAVADACIALRRYDAARVWVRVQ